MSWNKNNSNMVLKDSLNDFFNNDFILGQNGL